jgi:hypothetical protein
MVSKAAKRLKGAASFVSNAALEKKVKMLNAEIKFQRSIRQAQADRLKIYEADNAQLTADLDKERKDHNDLKQIMEKVHYPPLPLL